MVRQANERNIVECAGTYGGGGEMVIRHLLNGSEEMYGCGRVFAHTTLKPGCAVGYHMHEAESETYYILSGTGRFNDNGRFVDVCAGDVTFTGAGEGHGLENTGDGPLEIMALILFQKQQ